MEEHPFGVQPVTGRSCGLIPISPSFCFGIKKKKEPITLQQHFHRDSAGNMFSEKSASASTITNSKRIKKIIISKSNIIGFFKVSFL